MSNTFNQLLAEQKHASQLESRLEVTEDKNLELKHQLHSLNDNLTFALDEKDRLIEKNSNLKKSIANMESTVKQYIQNQENATSLMNKLATTERVKEKYREENHQLEDLRKKLMAENKKVRTEHETLKFDMNTIQDEYQDYKHKYEEIEHSNRSLLDRQEIG